MSKTQPPIRLHSHPHMERRLHIDAGHAIVDTDALADLRHLAAAGMVIRMKIDARGIGWDVVNHGGCFDA